MKNLSKHYDKQIIQGRSAPKQERSLETKRRILAATLELVQEKGFHAISTNEIAAHASMPVGSVYRYFNNMDDILISLVRLYEEDIYEKLVELADLPLIKPKSNKDLFRLVTYVFIEHDRDNSTFRILNHIKANPAHSALLIDFAQSLVPPLIALLPQHRNKDMDELSRYALIYSIISCATSVAWLPQGFDTDLYIDSFISVMND